MDKNLKIERFVTEKKLNRYIDRLYPICRSILGKGYRESLKILGEIVDLNIKKVRSGTNVLDWTVPMNGISKMDIF